MLDLYVFYGLDPGVLSVPVQSCCCSSQRASVVSEGTAQYKKM